MYRIKEEIDRAYYEKRYPIISGNKVDGLFVRDDVPNTDSISATFTDYETLKGIREVLMGDFEVKDHRGLYYSKTDRE